MNRDEAVTFLRQVLGECRDMSPNAMSFEKSTNSESVGYTVHIKGTIHESDRQIVRGIAQKHSLLVKDNADGVIVYRPK